MAGEPVIHVGHFGGGALAAIVAGFQVIDGQVAQSGEEQGAQIPCALVRIGAPDRKEGVLDKVFGNGPVAGADLGEAQEVGMLAAEEMGQGGGCRGSLRCGRVHLACAG